MLHRREPGRRSTFLLVTLLVVASALSATAYTLWRLRVETIDRHFDAASMHARAFEDHLTHTFNVIDLTLTAAVDETGQPAGLEGALRHAPYLRSLALIDAEGKILASSSPANIGSHISPDDFLPAATLPRGILRAGRPWIGRDFGDARPSFPNSPAAPDAQTLIPVMRDVPASGNNRWLKIAASINPDYFLNYYSRNMTADPGTVDVYRYDGTLLFSTDTRRKPGSTISDPGLMKRLAGEEIGQLERSDESGRAVLTAFRGARSYPFAVVVDLAFENALAPWRREAWRMLFGVLSLLAVGVALATLYFLRLERAARQHEGDLEQLRLRGAALEAAANAIFITDRRGNIEWGNPAFCAMSGYTMDEVLGRNPREIIKSGRQAADRYRELWRTILAGEVWRGELINRRKDGSTYPEELTITPVRDKDGECRHFIAVKEDVTERRQSERRMAELSRHLVVVQESARRRLSGELHDRTSPNLAAIGVNLDIIVASLRLDEFPELAARLDDIRALLDDTTASIREVCSDLRPPVLDYAGLVAALESYLRQFQRRTGITTRFKCASPQTRLSAAVESMLFRIVQEALTNGAKHSRASEIEVTLDFDEDTVRLAVSDNGVGFDPASLGRTTHASGLGILTMREMAEFHTGRFLLDSIPGGGTRINVDIPRHKEET